MVRSGLLALLTLDDRLAVVGEATNGDQAVSMVRALRPDVTLLDVQMPRRDGVSAAQEISSLTHVLMTTFSDTPEVIHAAVDAGALGYLVHGTFGEDELVSCVLAAAVRQRRLRRPRDGRAAGGPAQPGAEAARPRPQRAPGRDHGPDRRWAARNADIARELFLAEKTVKNHINHIFARLGVRSRAEAVSLWLGGTTSDRLKPL